MVIIRTFPPSTYHGQAYPGSFFPARFRTDSPSSQHRMAIAQAMGVVEDYHGYYDPTIGSLVTQTVEDMLIEAAPRPCTAEEAAGGAWQDDTDSIVRLLNWAWQQYLAESAHYEGWEAAIIQRFLAVPAASNA